MYVTITDLDYYMGERKLKIGQKLTLKKDFDNPYDDEAINALDDNNKVCGIVANSIDDVARGSHSAGYIYNDFDTTCVGTVRFVLDDKAIVEIIE